MTTTREARGDTVVRATLPWVCAALVVLHVAAAAANAVSDGSRTGLAVAVHAGAAALLAVLALLGAVTASRRVATAGAQQLTAGAFAVSYAATLADVIATGRPAAGALLAVAVALVAVAFPEPTWAVVVAAAAWVAWVAGAVVAAEPRAWAVPLAVLVAATAVGAVVHQSRARLLAELAQARDVAAAAAVRDNLTGLANRRGLAMLGAQIVETARRQGDAVHCVFLDLDGFRVVNETLGRETGDEVLVAVADVLRAATRSTDVVARWGGDEFCIVGPGPGTAPLELERRVRERLLSQPPVPTDTWEPRVSAGGAMLAPWDSGTLDTLLGKADQEMYLRRAVRREGAPLPPRRVPGQ